MILPKHVTFTGLDACTDLDRCSELSQLYPIEWGVLFGGRLGKNRYPAPHIRAQIERSDLRLAFHLCGQPARNAQKGKHLHVTRYNRIQVNAREYDYETLRGQSAILRKPIILQWREITFPAESSFSLLFDRSGGKGRRSTIFPDQPNEKVLVGYAGGISPENVTGTIKRISATKYWLDMETGVRTDDWLDLDKCEAVCRAIWGGRNG